MVMPFVFAASMMVRSSSTERFVPLIVIFVMFFTYLLSQCRQRMASAIALSL